MEWDEMGRDDVGTDFTRIHPPARAQANDVDARTITYPVLQSIKSRSLFLSASLFEPDSPQPLSHFQTTSDALHYLPPPPPPSPRLNFRFSTASHIYIVPCLLSITLIIRHWTYRFSSHQTHLNAFLPKLDRIASDSPLKTDRLNDF
jgi:hypothetical protein